MAFEATYPVSPLQQGMLFNARFAPGAGVEILQVVGELAEAVDVDAFERAWRSAVSRHPVLRTTFFDEGLTQAIQRVHTEARLDFVYHDQSTHSEDNDAKAFAAYLESDRRDGFDLEHGPAVRVALFRTGHSHYRFLWTVPHVVVDGTSLPIVLEEVFGEYDAIRSDRTVHFPRRRPFRDHVDWLHARDLGPAETFWRSTLRGFAAPTPFEVDHPARNPDPRPGSLEHRLARDVTARLAALALEHGLGLSTFVHGAWAVVLSRYSGDEDVLFGTVRACRGSGLPEARSMVGLLINTLPTRVRVAADRDALAWLQELRAHQRAARQYEHTPLISVRAWSEVPGGKPLFESIVVYDRGRFDTSVRSRCGQWATRHFTLQQVTTYPLTLYAYGEGELALTLAFDRNRFEDESACALLGHVGTVLEGFASTLDRPLKEVPFFSATELATLLVSRNSTARAVCGGCLHEGFERQARETPRHVAITFDDHELTYGDLDARANQLAHRLRRAGVGPDVIVGILVERNVEMVVGLLGILKAGGAYLPLDPSYPRGRLAYMLEDSGAVVLVTQASLRDRIPTATSTVIALDADWGEIDLEPRAPVESGVTREHLAYLIYTSGSTGRPKGVMVEHRNVTNFLAAMDEVIGREPGVWLAATSISFDISVLELFWTLSRGFRVVIQSDREIWAGPAPSARGDSARTPVDVSLFYFASDENEGSGDKYRLLLEGARFADARGLRAVWTPERHFHRFGGLYPNPAVAAAALATITDRVQIRAGSVVLPLHHPVRVAEDWAVVDNLSHGRVGISFASGWHANDFIFAPDAYASRKAQFAEQIDVVRRLWRGDAVRYRDGVGGEVDVRILPRPVQPELPVWVTAAGAPDTFRLAGQLGAGILTHLLGQGLNDLQAKIRAYREAWQTAGHSGRGSVVLMLHTFVDDDEEAARRTVREPFLAYLKSSSDLVRQHAQRVLGDHAAPTSEEMREVWNQVFERYYETSGLFGAPARCRRMIDGLRQIGVDEVACLVDFGVDTEAVLASLTNVAALQEPVAATTGAARDSLAAIIRRHGVTHFQCTPSLIRVLMMTPGGSEALGSLNTLLVGGEALSSALVQALATHTPRRIFNMYGPTETAVWSTCDDVHPGEGAVGIGRPLANTEVYVLDEHLRPVPDGVPGELFIGGAGVARGYWRRPDLTRERFVPHPFTNDSARLYRTGDRVRYGRDGRLEFLGRIDDQVKLRGFRIELGEIESTVRTAPGVREAVAVVADVAGESQLVCFVVLSDDASMTTTSLREFAIAQLPDYMVPAAFVMLPSLPLTPNGKVDRKSLSGLVPTERRTSSEYIAPRTPVEQTLARLWTEVLGVQRIGAHDNFFDLGGNSLSAVSIAFRVRQALGADLALPAFFKGPTLAALASELESSLLANADVSEIEQLLNEIEPLPDQQVHALLDRAQPPPERR